MSSGLIYRVIWFVLLIGFSLFLLQFAPLFSPQLQASIESTIDDFRQLLPFISLGEDKHFYVDSVLGSDTNSGTSETSPWRSLAKVNSTTFEPGSVIHFRRGRTWTGGLHISDSGTQAEPIIFTTYGSGGRPVIQNPAANEENHTSAIEIGGDYIIIEGFRLENTSFAGVNIYDGAEFNTVRDIEATQVGIGVAIYGQNNLVTGSYLHDMKMIRNTPGGDDDYGALGILIQNDFNEVSYNYIVRCIAPSYDYGVDGGAVELFEKANGSKIHHNFASDNAGFLEAGAGTFRNVVVSYNVSVDNQRFVLIHLQGPFEGVIENMRIENNTMVENATNEQGWKVIDFNGIPTNNTLILRNNIISANNFQVIANAETFTHENNLYDLRNGTTVGYPAHPSEIIDHPGFVNPSDHDYHLESTSPAIDQGLDLGYTEDFDGNPVPSGARPDLGAYEYVAPPSR